jgi:hypothetical protein
VAVTAAMKPASAPAHASRRLMPRRELRTRPGRGPGLAGRRPPGRDAGTRLVGASPVDAPRPGLRLPGVAALAAAPDATAAAATS